MPLHCKSFQSQLLFKDIAIFPVYKPPLLKPCWLSRFPQANVIIVFTTLPSSSKYTAIVKCITLHLSHCLSFPLDCKILRLKKILFIHLFYPRCLVLFPGSLHTGDHKPLIDKSLIYKFSCVDHSLLFIVSFRNNPLTLLYLGFILLFVAYGFKNHPKPPENNKRLKLYYITKSKSK